MNGGPTIRELEEREAESGADRKLQALNAELAELSAEAQRLEIGGSRQNPPSRVPALRLRPEEPRRGLRSTWTQCHPR